MFGDSRRRSLRVLHPAQIRLPLYLLALTGGFLSALAAIAYVGIMRPLAAARETLPPSMLALTRLLAEDFAVMTSLTAMLYAALVLGFCVTCTQRFLGPIVAFRRHLGALVGGDFSARVRLRDGDEFQDVADDLNELAELISENEKPGVAHAREL